MRNFINKIKALSQKQKTLLSFIFVYIFLLVSTFTINNFIVKSFTYLGLLLIPFLIIILLFFDTTRFNTLMKYRWFKFLIYIALTVYLIYANSYASTAVNNVFHVSSSFFPTTTLILTFHFALSLFVELLNKISILWSIVFSIFIIIFIIFKKHTYFLLTFVGTVFIAFILGISIPILLNKNIILKEIALKFDFYKQFYCSGLENVDSLVFLSDNNVLVHYKIPVKNQEFGIEECHK